MKIGPHNILNIYFERKKLSFPHYSLRALARDLNISPAYASTIMSGKKPIPLNQLQAFIKLLELDDIAILQLKNALYPEAKKDLPANDNQLDITDLDFINKYKPLDKKKYDILNNWYNIAILDLTTCEGFESSPVWISKKLKISQLETEIAIENLKRHKLLQEIDGKLQKVELKIRFPTKISQTVVRKFHKEMIKKAYDEISTKTEDADFEHRLILGSTFAVNESKIGVLKEIIQKALYEVSSSATDGPCQSVYQLNIQFFPLAK